MKIWQGKGRWVQIFEINPELELCALEIEDKGYWSEEPMSAFTLIGKEEALRLAEGLRQFVKACNENK